MLQRTALFLWGDSLKDWFTFNDKRCTEFGMHVMEHPSFIRPQERVENKTIPGRSGSLTFLEGENVFEDLTLSATCIVQDPKNIPRICGWLKGEGTICFANRPEGFYYGRIANQISFDKVLRGNPHRSFSVEFRCEPYFYLYDSHDIALTQSGQTLTNIGNVPSQPLIKIYGSGNVNLTINGRTVMIDDLDSIGGMIYVDCEAKLAYTIASDGYYDLRTSHVEIADNEWIVLDEGDNKISWAGVSNADETSVGEVSRVVVSPRWRNIG